MDYVTIVSVESATPKNESSKSEKRQMVLLDQSVESQFITVLAINGELPGEALGELLIVTRELGEKLGFGLKFIGGNSGSHERIKKLFIQSCAPNSPASRATPTWGSLGEGDEILKINGASVNTMSRLECVKNLKESDVHIKLFVRHGTGKIELSERALARSNSLKNGKPPTPPQAPPRKILKRNSSYPEPGTVSYPIATEEDLFNVPPPPAEFYLNSIDDFGKGFDSDDTGSTISTVIDRFIFDSSDLKVNQSQELAKALKPFTMLEKEFNIQPEAAAKPEEIPPVNHKLSGNDVVKLEINNYENVKLSDTREKQNNYENVDLKVSKSELNSYENMMFDQVKPSKIPVHSPPVPKPRQQPQLPPVEPRKRTKFPVKSNVYKSNKESVGNDFFESTVHEYKTIENWLQETDGNEDTGIDGEPEKSSFGEILPRCVEFVPKDMQHTSRIAIKQCIKVSNAGGEVYNTSSDDDDDEEEQDHDKEKVYEPIMMETNSGLGEKLGPPELLDGFGPTEAYFNGFQWTNHALALPTIGEVEEELSSIEPQAVVGSGVIVNSGGDKQQQQQRNQQPRQQLPGSAAGEEEEKIMSSTVTVSAAIKTDTATQYLVSSNPASTAASAVICGDNGGKNGSPSSSTLTRIEGKAESAAVNGVTLLDQSKSIAAVVQHTNHHQPAPPPRVLPAINLDEGRIRINNSSMESCGMPAAVVALSTNNSTLNDMPPRPDKAPLSVTNIDEIRNALANDCEPTPVNEPSVKKGPSSDRESQLLGGPKTKASIVNRSTSSIVIATSCDQNNNNNNSNCDPDRNIGGGQRSAPSTTLNQVQHEEKLRDCVRGIDTVTTTSIITTSSSSTTINNGNHVRNNNNNKTIEPRSVINGLLKTDPEIQPEIIVVAERVVDSICSSSRIHNGGCDKEPISSVIEAKVLTKVAGSEVAPKIESEIPLITRANQFAQLERRIILGGSGAVAFDTEIAQDSTVDENNSGSIPGRRRNNSADCDQRETAQTRKVNLLGDSDTKRGTTLGQHQDQLKEEGEKNNRDVDLWQAKSNDKNQVSEKMDPITDSVTAEIVIAVTGGAVNEEEMVVIETVVVPGELEVVGGGKGDSSKGEHIIGSDDVDLTEVDQSSNSDQKSAAAAALTEEKSTTATDEEVTQPEEKEMDRGLLSLVSNNSNSSSTSSSTGTVIVNKSLSPMSGPLLMSPPTFSRLPPDGHEFPPNFTEPLLLTGAVNPAANNNNGQVTSTITNNSTMVRSQPQHHQNGKVVEATMKISSRSTSDEPPAPPKSAPPQSLKIGRTSSNGGGSAFVEMRRKSIETSSEISNGMLLLKSTPSTPLGGHKMKGSEWRKDEKSEKSVRDKIAMFSKEPPSPPTEHHSPSGLRKSWNRSTDDLLSAGSTSSHPSSFGDNLSTYSSSSTVSRESMSKKARSVENLDDCIDGPVSSPKYRDLAKNNNYDDLTSYRPTFKKTYSVDVLNDPALRDEPVYYKPLNEDFSSKYASLPRRMSAMNSSVTASNPQLTRTTSFSGSTESPNITDRRRSSISNMLEQRKKSMSKLRGLIIPEKSAGFEMKRDSILFDLPEIKSADLEKVVPMKGNLLGNGKAMNGNGRIKPQMAKVSSYNAKEINPPVRPAFHSQMSAPVTSTTPYQSIFEMNRRSFGGSAVLGTKNGLKDNKLTQGTALPPTKPPRTSLIYSPQRSYMMDDSEDSDSIISLQSSRISSPPQSPVAPANTLTVPEKLPLTRTLSSETNTSIASSTASTLTSGSGSQASCSSMGSTPTGPDSKRKMVKGAPLNESSMNRKSVLASAKTRNGNAKNMLEDQANGQGRFEDEDSTDGYDEEQQVFKRPKPKQRNSVSAQPPQQLPQNGKANTNGMTNYKLVSEKDNSKDLVIKVATCVEIVDEMPPPQTSVETIIQMTSQLILSEREDAAKNFVPPSKEQKKEPLESKSGNGETKSSASESEPEMNDLVKWVRTEAAKTNSGMSIGVERNGRIVKSIPSSPSPVSDRPIVPAKKLTTADLRKQFELKANSVGSSNNGTGMKPGPITISPPVKEKTNFHDRFSSWESVASNSSSGISSMPTRSIPSSETAQSTPTDFGSFTSIGSSHSLLTAQDLQAIIEEADPPLKTPDAFVIVLQRESPESSIGITLAGGADYEAKEITVHKVLTASPAEKDGRLKKGDRILAINGLSMRGLTHRESVTVLKTPRSEVVLAVTRSPSAVSPGATKAKRPSLGSLSSLLERDCDEVEAKKSTGYHKTSRSLDLDAMICDGDSVCSSELLDERNPVDGDHVVPVTFKKMVAMPKGGQEVEIMKDTCGLGFSIEGGFDSPLGNCPLTVKKVFMGGAAEKSGRIRSGNEIAAINGYTTTNMTRVSAWNYMKKLPLGPVRIVIL